MSRSRKKSLVFKDTANRAMKPIAARRHRRAIKQAMVHGAEFLEELPLMDETTNPYDVCDYVILCGLGGWRCKECWRPEEERYKCHMK